jgi:hypothetical protein
VGGDFPDRLDEVSEHYLSKGACEGEECSHLKVQVGHWGQFVHVFEILHCFCIKNLYKLSLKMVVSNEFLQSSV